MKTATIFYINEQWLADQPNPFGVRYNASILPRGSVVVGFLKWDGNQVQELLDDTLSISVIQEQAWNDTLGEARAVLRGLPVVQ